MAGRVNVTAFKEEEGKEDENEEDADHMLGNARHCRQTSTMRAICPASVAEISKTDAAGSSSNGGRIVKQGTTHNRETRACVTS